MIVVFLLISVIFLSALVAAPLSVILVSLAVWGRRHEAEGPITADLPPRVRARSA